MDKIDKLHIVILILRSNGAEQKIQKILHENYTKSNCDCVDTNDTATMKSVGAVDIEICLQCFGAIGWHNSGDQIKETKK